jgi:hypothetical protein
MRFHVESSPPAPPLDTGPERPIQSHPRKDASMVLDANLVLQGLGLESAANNYTHVDSE